MRLSRSEFPGYQAERLLYQGPLSRVWQVKRQEAGRSRYALKEFLNARSAPLLRELACLASVRHPNIVECLDAGLSDEGGAFLVFELATRGNLRERLLKAPLGPLQWLRLAEQLLSALVVAHAHGIVHRDIKPENVLVFGRQPVVFKLADLGLSSSAGQAALGPSLGTPAYMAPEQFAGRISARSDLYSLGILLFEAGCGRLPYPSGGYTELREQHQNRPVDWAAWGRPRWRPWLEKLLAKDPLQRPATAEQALAELKEQPHHVAASIPPPLRDISAGECIPILRERVESCRQVFFVPRRERLQLWAFQPGACRIWERQVGSSHWSPQPSGPPMQAWSGGCPKGGVWIAEGLQVSRMDWNQTRSVPQLRVPNPIDQLLYAPQPGVLIVASGRTLRAFQDGGGPLWSANLPHYWGPPPLALWGSSSLAVAVGPVPSKLLKLDLLTGRLEAELSLPAPSLAIKETPGTPGLSAVLADLSHFEAGHTGVWSIDNGGSLAISEPLPANLSWARAHPCGFSVGRASAPTILLDSVGKLVAQIPSRGLVTADSWSEDGSCYAWLEEENGLPVVRVADILFRGKEALWTSMS